MQITLLPQSTTQDNLDRLQMQIIDTKQCLSVYISNNSRDTVAVYCQWNVADDKVVKYVKFS